MGRREPRSADQEEAADWPRQPETLRGTDVQQLQQNTQNTRGEPGRSVQEQKSLEHKRVREAAPKGQRSTDD